MLDDLLDQMTQMPLAEAHEVVQTLASYRFHEPFRVAVAVWTVCRNRGELHATRLQECRPGLREPKWKGPTRWSFPRRPTARAKAKERRRRSEQLGSVVDQIARVA